MNVRADSHIHLFEHGYDSKCATSAELAGYDALRKACGIEAALVVGYEGARHFEGNNSYVLSLKDENPWVHPLCYFPAAGDPGADAIRQVQAAGYAGVAVYLDEDGADLDLWRPETLRELGRAGLVSVNAGPASIARFGAVLSGLGAPVLVSHLGLPGPGAAHEVLEPLLALAKHPQFFVKVSGTYAIDPEYPHAGAEPSVRTLIESFGPARLLWGSDYSPVLDFSPREAALEAPSWLTALMDHDALDAIMGRTLLRLLGHIG